MYNPLNALALILAPVTTSPEAVLLAAALLAPRARALPHYPRHRQQLPDPHGLLRDQHKPQPLGFWRGGGRVAR